jgi:NitT/TauT family transport system permease protein
VLQQNIRRKILLNVTAYGFIGMIIILLVISLGLRMTSFNSLRITLKTTGLDLLYTLVRVTALALLAWSSAVIGGWLMAKGKLIRELTLPAVNFIRHISPFAWFPFAVIWFGLGEFPVAFILFVTLFFPALIAVREIFADIRQEYEDEAQVCGADIFQLFFYIELPLILVSLLNLLRILWGLGWTVIIAAEMLGTATGLGYRLLDFRYLLFYEEMIVYLILMGIVGVLVDHLLRKLTERCRETISA